MSRANNSKSNEQGIPAKQQGLNVSPPQLTAQNAAAAANAALLAGRAPGLAAFPNAAAFGVPLTGGPPNQQQHQRLIQLQLQQRQLQMQLQSQQQAQQLLRQQQQQQQAKRSSGSKSSKTKTSPTSLTRPPNLPTAAVNMEQLLGAQQAALQRQGSSTTLQRNKASSASSLVAPLMGATGMSQEALAAAAADMQQKPPLTEADAAGLVRECNVIDKTLWVSRQVLGSSSVNGFVRATATAQRVKRQRARQVNFKKPEGLDEQMVEELLKKECLNVRTAKKLRMEMTQGLMFCQSVHATIRDILKQLDPSRVPPVLDGRGLERRTRNAKGTGGMVAIGESTQRAPAPSNKPSAGTTSSRASSTSSSKSKKPPTPLNVTAGDPSGSTLRKARKRKTSDYPPLPDLSEHDASGKRIVAKKEHTWRIFQALRFRALKQGDYVAARVTSRDLFILARVVQDYPAAELSPSDFLKLSDSKRDSLFRDKVVIMDVEDSDSRKSTLVDRTLVLPLPRSHAEGNEWCTRIKKGARVYAMYPMTTSLYAATVIDSTTYCRGEDDVLVVEFDGDEQDAKGGLPRYHIPARFVSLIPREFAASQTTNSKKQPDAPEPLPGAKPAKRGSTSKKKGISGDDAALNDMISQMAYGAGSSQDLPLDPFGLGLG